MIKQHHIIFPLSLQPSAGLTTTPPPPPPRLIGNWIPLSNQSRKWDTLGHNCLLTLMAKKMFSFYS